MRVGGGRVGRVDDRHVCGPWSAAGGRTGGDGPQVGMSLTLRKTWSADFSLVNFHFAFDSFRFTLVSPKQHELRWVVEG
jgi:hypothetical protein